MTEDSGSSDEDKNKIPKSVTPSTEQDKLSSDNVSNPESDTKRSVTHPFALNTDSTDIDAATFLRRFVVPLKEAIADREVDDIRLIAQRLLDRTSTILRAAQSWSPEAQLYVINELVKYAQIIDRFDSVSSSKIIVLIRRMEEQNSRKQSSELNFEEELDIPAFLRRQGSEILSERQFSSVMESSEAPFTDLAAYRSAVHLSATIFAKLNTQDALRTFPAHTLTALFAVVGVYAGPYIHLISQAFASEQLYQPPLGLPQNIFTGIVLIFVALLVVLILGLFYVGYILKPKNQSAANAVSHLVVFLAGALLGHRG